MLFGRAHVTFPSDYPIAEAVERLSAATHRPAFGGYMESVAVGRVDERRVRLVRVSPLVRNSFVPVFSGAFEEAEGHVTLRGSFAMHVSVKVFMGLWFGFALMLAAIATGRAMQHRTDAWKIALASAGIMGFGIGLVALGKWFARNDVAWLSTLIRGALTRSGR